MKQRLTFYEKQHLQRMIQQQGSIKYIYDDFIRKVGVHMTGWTDTGSGDIWMRNKRIENAIQKELTELHSKMLLNMDDFATDAWKRSNLKNDELVSAFIKDMAISETAKKGMFARNADAFKAFMNRKSSDGLTLSDRVWRVMGSAKENIEFYLESGLSTGRPAALISQDVRQLLKEPDRIFHRIRNSKGKLVPSAPMAAYHPGTGVYRSSYMNALRLAVTNTNEMYRTADHDRWKSLPFVIGFDVKRSANAADDCPICEAMVGRYPKEYLFRGNHAFCICYATPVLNNEDEFVDALVNDDFSAVKQIEDLPTGPRSFIQEQIDKGKLTKDSYFLRQNKQFFK